MLTRCLSFALLASLATPLLAQEEAAPGDGAPLADAPAEETNLEQRVAALDAELERLKQRLDDEEDDSDLSGWQLQIRFGWVNLAHNHRNSVFKADDHQHGWSLGVGFQAPLWRDLAPSVDLYGHLAIEYRQIAYSTVARAPITNASVTINYLNVTVAPTVLFRVSDVVRPFVFTGFNMQVASPPEDGIGYLDLGWALGCGVDFALHEHVSLGVEYKYTWFGVADQEEEDYGQATAYLGFNF